jgi:hypothetical protein
MPTIRESDASGYVQNDWAYCGQTEWRAQTFTASGNYSLGSVDVSILLLSGVSGNVTVYLYAASGNLPTGGVLATSNSVPYSSWNTSNYSVVNITFPTPYSLVSGTQYALVYRADQAYTNLRISLDSSNPYANGQASYSSNSGSSWTAYTGEDFYFQIYDNSGATFLATAPLIVKQAVNRAATY